MTRWERFFDAVFTGLVWTVCVGGFGWTFWCFPEPGTSYAFAMLSRAYPMIPFALGYLFGEGRFMRRWRRRHPKLTALIWVAAAHTLWPLFPW